MNKQIELTPEQMVQMVADAINVCAAMRADHSPANWAHDMTHLLALCLAYIVESEREAAIADISGALRELVPGYATQIAFSAYGKGGRA